MPEFDRSVFAWGPNEPHAKDAKSATGGSLVNCLESARRGQCFCDSQADPVRSVDIVAQGAKLIGMAGLDRRRAPDIERLTLERCRAMTPAQKMRQLVDLNAFIIQSQINAVRAAHPGADEHEVRMRVAWRWVRNQDRLKLELGWDVSEMGY